MKIVYHESFNFDLGLLRRLHPFDATKFRTIHRALDGQTIARFVSPEGPIEMEMVDAFLSPRMRQRVRDRESILQALEIPNIPLLTYSFLESRVLLPMRWGVAGTLLAAREALQHGGICWNLSGGYHHASPDNMEGFCIYNDIGICHQQLCREGLLNPKDPILIVDTDAHHGNGNAQTFLDNPAVTLLDVYNTDIYPTSQDTRARVNLPVPIGYSTSSDEYLQRLNEALNQLDSGYRIAFVIAGTDVLDTDLLGGLRLRIEDVAARDRMTLETLSSLNIPSVVLGGGGYSKESSQAVIRAIQSCSPGSQ